MALQPMCQPGMPGPYRLGISGSPSRDGRHSTKSKRLRFSGLSGFPPRSRA